MIIWCLALFHPNREAKASRSFLLKCVVRTALSMVCMCTVSKISTEHAGYQPPSSSLMACVVFWYSFLFRCISRCIFFQGRSLERIYSIMHDKAWQPRPRSAQYRFHPQHHTYLQHPRRCCRPAQVACDCEGVRQQARCECISFPPLFPFCFYFIIQTYSPP